MQSLVRGEWRRDEEMMGEISALGSMLPDHSQFSVLSQRQGSSTHASRTSRWIQACILVPSDDRSVTAVGP